MLRGFAAIVLTALAFAAQPAIAQPAPFCAAQEAPRFTGGFAPLAQALGASIGQPTECAHTETATGDAVQRTSTGLAYWRKSTNAPSFTTGTEHWALIDEGLVSWTGTSIDPPQLVLRHIEEQVVQLRGLVPLEVVPIEFLDGAGVDERLARAEAENLADPRFAGVPQLLALLGLLGPDEDLFEISRQVGREQVAGVYDDEEKVLYVVGAAGDLGLVERVSFAHEYTHALQDQHFDLRSLLNSQADNDHARALTALVEGDAVNSAVAWAQTYLTQAELTELIRLISVPQPALEGAPLVVRDEGLFPYDAGADFVDSLSHGLGSAGVDKAFEADPPESTEQVLHSDKYAAHDPPVEVVLPDLATALGGGWRQVASNVLGELDLRILIEQYATHDSAVAATTGWGGDRWALLDQGGQSALVLRTTWESDANARAFYEAYAQGLRQRFPQGTVGDRTDSNQTLVTEATSTSLRLHERDVTLVLAADPLTVERIKSLLR